MRAQPSLMPCAATDRVTSIEDEPVVSLIGASGFIGRHLLRYLSLQRLRVKVLIHKNMPECEWSDKTEVIPGDLMNPETLKEFIEPGDTVVNLVYLGRASRDENISAIQNLMAVCEKAGIRRLIHCSTARVSGRSHDRPVTEASICRPVSEYAETKLEIENVILSQARSFEVVILRPTAVFGPGGVNLVPFVHDLRNRKKPVNYIMSCLFGRSKQNLVYIDNVTSAISYLLFLPLKQRQETFIISDDDAPSNTYRGVERFFFSHFGWEDYPVPPLQLPLFLLTFLADLMNKFNNPAALYDCGKILQTGFNRPVAFEEGVSRFTQWYQDKFRL